MPKYWGGLGFKDFQLFNVALLGKQAWRILQNPESLSAKILKASYFPTTNFLGAQLRRRPSQIWRSIMAGRDVLSQGLIKHIDNGCDTNIWADNWLPRDFMLCPLICTHQQPPALVVDFIVQAKQRWDEEKLRSCMLDMDV